MLKPPSIILPDPSVNQSKKSEMSRDTLWRLRIIGVMAILFGVGLPSYTLAFGEWNTTYKYQIVGASYGIEPALRKYAVYKALELPKRSISRIDSRSSAVPSNLKPGDIVEKKGGELEPRVNNMRQGSRLLEISYMLIVPIVSVIAGITFLFLGRGKIQPL